MVYKQELLIYICIRLMYNTRGMSNMHLNDGPHGACAGACLTSSGVHPKNGLVRYPVQSRRGGAWEQSIYKRSSFSVATAYT